MPDFQKIRDHRHLQMFGTLLHEPNLWHLNRRSVSGAFAVGLFMAFVPVPFQMVLAAAAAIAFRVCLPVAVALVWITNPFTMPPLFYFAYKVGGWILNEPTHQVNFEISIDWMMTRLGTIWEPFLLGCFVLGVSGALLGSLLIHWLWRLHVIRNWQKRKRVRLGSRTKSKSKLDTS